MVVLGDGDSRGDKLATLNAIGVFGFLCARRQSELAQGNELGVAEDGAGGPFGEFDFGFGFGAEPGVVGHFFGGDAFAPVRLAAGHRGEVDWENRTPDLASSFSSTARRSRSGRSLRSWALGAQ